MTLGSLRAAGSWEHGAPASTENRRARPAFDSRSPPLHVSPKGAVQMKILPWRREDAFPTQSLASWIQRFFDEDGWFNAPFASRLPATFTSANIPPVDVAETEQAITVNVELPGLDEKDIDVTFQGNQLTIRAERKFEEEKKDTRYHRVERQYGTFTRTLPMPDNLKSDAIDARYKNGVLTITIPKVEPTPAAKVKVRAG